jgi:flagellar basal-body rod modification protein FlgD
MALEDLISQLSSDTITQATAAATTTSNTLGKNDFLQMLVTQMKNQDPLDPMKNEDFIAQLAQFSTLEQMTNLNTNFETMLSMQTLTQASNLLGKNVSWLDSDNAEQSGIVDAVEIVNGSAVLSVGDQMVDVTSVFAIANP